MIEQWFATGILLLVIGFILSTIFYILFHTVADSSKTVTQGSIGLILLICLFASIWGFFQILISGLVWMMRWAF